MLNMCDKTFILTMEKELWFNINASAFVYNKTLEYSIYRENLVKEFAIGNKFKVNRTYTQKIVKTLKKHYSFSKRC